MNRRDTLWSRWYSDVFFSHEGLRLEGRVEGAEGAGEVEVTGVVGSLGKGALSQKGKGTQRSGAWRPALARQDPPPPILLLHLHLPSHERTAVTEGDTDQNGH